MDPMLGDSINTSPIMAASNSYIFAKGIFFNEEQRNAYLSQLDSDTRDYVMKNTDNFRTRQDVEDYVDKLHGKRT